MFTCVYIGLALLVLTMSERDNNDHNQKDQCVKEQSQKNPKSDLQSIWDNERAQDARAYFNEQDKLLQALLNVGIQPVQRENTPKNTPNSELENL